MRHVGSFLLLKARWGLFLPSFFFFFLLLLPWENQSQLLLKPIEVELGLQVGVEFDNTASLTAMSPLAPILKNIFCTWQPLYTFVD